MKKTTLVILALFSTLSYGQSQVIPMESAYWEYDSSKVEFIRHRSASAAQSINGNYFELILKDQTFMDGIIEFDVELTGNGFPGIVFRSSQDQKNGEHFYIRSFGEFSPLKRTTLQYAALVDGVSLWDLTDEYQAGATIYKEGWNHIKLVIAGKQMRAYINDMEKPALSVPKLEGTETSGGITLSGNVIYANFQVKHGVTEGLNPDAGVVSTENDPRYIRNWQVSNAIDFPFGNDLVIALPGMYGTLIKSDLPDSTTKWENLYAEDRALVNLTRKFGAVQNDGRRLAWIKTYLHSAKAQERTINLGFSDEIWIFINGQPLYVDKNYYGTPSQKEPRGRCTIENTSIKVPLTEGDNEILIGLANYFYGWGIIARFDDMEGITLK